jgi:DNA polymerase-3 subunit epsilon
MSDGVSKLDELVLNEILSNPNYQVLRRVPETYESIMGSKFRKFSAVIIDLETMGLEANKDAIIELGLLKFSFTNEEGITEVLDTYNELNDPHMDIPELVTKITGITNSDVSGKEIDWKKVSKLVASSDLVICHNAGFDRNFLELQTPEAVQTLFQKIPFGCTLNDIDWNERGYESRKLDYLNWKLGYFYEGHRALTDCWATFNLLTKEVGAFDELKVNVKAIKTILCAVDAPFDKKDLLRSRKYKWSDGSAGLPKCWWTVISQDEFIEETNYLEREVYCKKGITAKLPCAKITAQIRYSYRAEKLGN